MLAPDPETPEMLAPDPETPEMLAPDLQSIDPGSKFTGYPRHARASANDARNSVHRSSVSAQDENSPSARLEARQLQMVVQRRLRRRSARNMVIMLVECRERRISCLVSCEVALVCPSPCGARVFVARGAPCVSMTGRVRIKNTLHEESHLRIPPLSAPLHVIDLE